MSVAQRIRIERILSPVDFSEHSSHAVAYALALARRYGASLTVLHAYQSLPWFGVPRSGSVTPEPVPAPPESDVPILVDPPARHAAQEQMRELVEALDADEGAVHPVLEEGDPVDRLVHHAGEMQADLVVLGTHGRRGFERWMLGSVTERALRLLSCPIMAVPRPVEGSARRPDPVFKSIVCPLDFSSPSLRALDYALALAEEADGQVQVVHVVEELGLTEETRAFTVEEYHRYVRENAEARLHAAMSDETRERCNLAEVTVSGKPYAEILRVARDRRADLIVMGTHGRGAVGRLFLGSTTNQVAREAACPVLTLRTS